MKRDRLRELIAAYGADRSRWPKAESALFDGLGPDDPALADARRLDALLSRLETPPPNPALARRIVARAADLPQERSTNGARLERLSRWLPGFHLPVPRLPWPELTAMAAALVLGFYIGGNMIGYGAYTGQQAATTFGDAGLALSTQSPLGQFQSELFR